MDSIYEKKVAIPSYEPIKFSTFHLPFCSSGTIQSSLLFLDGDVSQTHCWRDATFGMVI